MNNPLSPPLFGFTSRAVSESGPISFVAATSVEARDGMILDVPSLRLDAYRTNPVVLYAHDGGGWGGEGRVIGRAAVRVDGSDLIAEITFDESEDNDIASRVARQVRDGMLNAVSVSWRGGRRTRRDELPADHPYYSDSDSWRNVAIYDGELLEISVVPVPADPRALAQRRLDESDALDTLYQTLRASLLAELGPSGSARTTTEPTAPPTWAEWLAASKE